MTWAFGLERLYWASAACVVYPTLVYPMLLAAWTRIRSWPVRRASEGEVLPSVSVVVAARDEEAGIARRVREFTGRIAAEGMIGEVIVVSDGSADRTAEAARACAGGSIPVTVIELKVNAGKAVALSAGCLAARNDVIALADARRDLGGRRPARLLENFADPEVGAVGGELFVESRAGAMAGVGLYWRYEKALRRMESLIHSTVGLSGSVCAVRRELFRPVPEGIVLDDVYWPLRVVMGGRRVVFDDRAHAFDRLPDEVVAEFRRKVRTLAGNFQLVARLPEALRPAQNPVWFALVSHKLMRLIVPWALMATALLAAALGGPLYRGLLAAQVVITLAGVAGLAPGASTRSRLTSAAASFLVLNAAAWLAFWVWATGRTSGSWTRTVYRPSPAAAALPAATR